jgi:hypothetical protein
MVDFMAIFNIPAPSNFKKNSCNAMLIYVGNHGCEELKGSGKCGCLLVPHQAVVVNDAIVHCPQSTVHFMGNKMLLETRKLLMTESKHMAGSHTTPFTRTTKYSGESVVVPQLSGIL